MTLTERVLEIKQFLQSTPIFQGVLDEQLQALANISILQTYKKGATIFLEGDPGSGFFIVKSGRIKVFKLANAGKEQILHIFAAGDHFAEVPAFDGGQFPASAGAIENSEVVFIPRAAFLMVLQQHPTLAIAILGTFARHLRKLTFLVDTLSFKEVPERLANYLLNLSSRRGNADVFELDLAKGQLAALLGTIPETLSRAFYKLSQDGMIEINGTSIKLCDRDRLMNVGQHK
ncbi:Crp/Fnr family transcriptional regulator [Calothrix sp. FACHB-1219]|uniref:Crp/Fnr family transcriptional regulator n=1 Tax=unclassified Calothrix TaxID=2619626 RepID=UPI0016847075|nr:MULTISPECIES: Crp/Fnr family transcriptional regulator [unclassified Calothrix]MBD2203482.1 Crp/Fnr family transcriptional regulator [Calothrix sp. FACHB-168]MBD2219074.1 Crp/Fnr family transcriptional regulator [Calothrix sp. FACHB-1219]